MNSKDEMNFWSSGSSSPLFFSGNQTKPAVFNADKAIRLAFLRKVYGILSAQLTLTALVSIFLTPIIHDFVIQNTWLLFLNMVANIASVIILCYKRNEFPTNFYLLGFFTLTTSFSLGMFASLYDINLVIQAVILTSTIVIGLTLYTFQTKYDFKWLGGVLISLLTVSLFGGIIHLFTGNSTVETILTAFGALIFSMYLIYDTQLIMRHLSAEEYIIGVLNLYADIINLFIKILKLLKALQQDENSKKKKKN